MYDLLIKNALIIDGSGKPNFSGSVGIKNEKISVLPAHTDETGSITLDGTNKYLCPGFIDSHSHGDAPLGKTFASLAKISQGITTQVTGMCGFSMFPVNAKNLPLLKDSLDLLIKDFPEEMSDFTSYKDYLAYANKLPKIENTMFLVGHVTLRVAVMGYDNRKPTQFELELMKLLLQEAMENGAGGLSSGLIYVPSAYAEEDELVELCKVVAKYDGVYTTHIRNEGSNSIQAVAEAIDVAKKSNVKLIISHHKISGKQNWGTSSQTLEMIDNANKSGLRVSCDQYPYTASMTHLSVCAPPKYYSDGLEGMVKYLKDPNMRAQICKEMNDPNTPYDNYYLNSGGWSGVFISKSVNMREVENMTIAEYAAQKNVDPFDVFCDIMIANNGVATALYFSMCDEDLFRIIKNKNVVVGTDGILRHETDKGHPRAFGTFPHAIRVFVKENHLFTLEEMIQKMTSLTAEKYSIKNKGYIKDGYDGDLVLFDYDKLCDKANFKEPNRLTEGISNVIVNGKIVYQDKKLTGITPGKII